eukprot:6278577-Pyramimonas_sp.AAC.1
MLQEKWPEPRSPNIFRAQQHDLRRVFLCKCGVQEFQRRPEQGARWMSPHHFIEQARLECCALGRTP